MRNIGTETKVGIFVLLGIILLTYFTVRVGRIAVREEGYRTYSTWNRPPAWTKTLRCGSPEWRSAKWKPLSWKA